MAKNFPSATYAFCGRWLNSAAAGCRCFLCGTSFDVTWMTLIRSSSDGRVMTECTTCDGTAGPSNLFHPSAELAGCRAVLSTVRRGDANPLVLSARRSTWCSSWMAVILQQTEQTIKPIRFLPKSRWSIFFCTRKSTMDVPARLATELGLKVQQHALRHHGCGSKRQSAQQRIIQNNILRGWWIAYSWESEKLL